MIHIDILTVAWSMCAMVALLHLLMWVKQRPNTIYLLSSVMALAVAGNAFFELMLMHAVSIDRIHVSTAKTERGYRDHVDVNGLVY